MVVAGHISLRGVTVHNLKSIDIDIPHGRLVVLCGPSGSGKSSLALDTLYAEGQRRYIESFSAHTRQFLDRLEKPAAERIEGIPPAIAVRAGRGARSGRATVGTATEIADYLRLLFAKMGEVVCRNCGNTVQCDTPQSVTELLSKLPAGTRCLIAFGVNNDAGSSSAATFAALREEGFVRAIMDQQVVILDEVAGNAASCTYVIVDRLAAGVATQQRIRDSLETALSKGLGKCLVFIAHAQAATDNSDALAQATFQQRGALFTIDGQAWRRLAFSESLACADCGIEYMLPEPRLFSFNSPLGACPKCEGLGHSRQDSVACPACGGTRLRPEALDARIGGKNIAQVSAMQVGEAAEFFRQLRNGDAASLPRSSPPAVGHKVPASPFLLDQVLARLGYLASVGLAYLTVDRPIRTLSSGETRRVSLTSALGSSLVNMLYVLDEPSTGLHPHDVDRLVKSLEDLRNRANTVVVAEHEPAVIRAADQVIEIGPGAGDRGGQIVFQGTPAEMESAPNSLTGAFLSGRRGHAGGGPRRPPTHGAIRLVGARGNNLKDITVDFPLGMLCLITGVSGAGKSTLVEKTLYPALCRRLRKVSPRPLDCDDVFGDGQLDDVILVDQDPIGRSPRSNPVTYLKIFDEIRNAFADTTEARARNYDAGYFSFNIDGGRCSLCQGEGYIKIDMQFLADLYRKCSQCRGTRYRAEILDVTYRGRNIADVLEMTVREAFAFFRGRSKVQSRLKRLIDVGLDYVRLGQPANTLSGGESQRLKLAGYMSRSKRGRCLFILNEPTTGLHMSDTLQLLDCFDALLSVGHSLIVVEHNLQVMKAADYIIDLGPGAANGGGQVVAKGTPEIIAGSEESITGRYLQKVLRESSPQEPH